MAFNLSSWSNKGKKWGRGSSPPPNSYEWCGVADPPVTQTGFQVFEISFTDLDAADRYIKHLYDSVVYYRKTQGSKIIDDQNLKLFHGFIMRWNEWRNPLGMTIRMMSKDHHDVLRKFLNEAHKLELDFRKKGMAPIPIPYMGELVSVLRQMPKQLRAIDMSAKLEAGIKCGQQMLLENTPWYGWRVRQDSKGLLGAIGQAQRASQVLLMSRRSSQLYEAGDPVYDDFLKILTRIFIEGAGLYGIEQTLKTAVAEAVDKAREQTEPRNYYWILALAGVGYLGSAWLKNRMFNHSTISVQDAIREE